MKIVILDREARAPCSDTGTTSTTPPIKLANKLHGNAGPGEHGERAGRHPHSGFSTVDPGNRSGHHHRKKFFHCWTTTVICSPAEKGVRFSTKSVVETRKPAPPAFPPRERWCAVSCSTIPEGDFLMKNRPPGEIEKGESPVIVPLSAVFGLVSHSY